MAQSRSEKHLENVYLFYRDKERNTLTEFNSSNTCRLNLQQTRDALAALVNMQERMAEKKELQSANRT